MVDGSTLHQMMESGQSNLHSVVLDICINKIGASEKERLLRMLLYQDSPNPLLQPKSLLKTIQGETLAYRERSFELGQV